MGISIEEQKKLSGVAVDIVVDSVSVATTFRETLAEKGIIFCSISDAIKDHPELVKKYQHTFKDSYMCTSPNVAELKERFEKLCQENNILYKMKDIIEASKRHVIKKQMSLFD